MRRVLVTGGSGFIGRHTLAPLLERGYEVHAVARRPLDAAPVAWHQFDLLDQAATRALIDDVRPTHLLHLAWYAEHGKYWSSPLNLDWVAASLHLLQAFAGAGGERATIAGTCAEYRWGGSNIYREGETPLEPATLYGASKGAVRDLATRYAPHSGVSLAWGRVFLLYGPHEQPQRLVASVARALLRGETAESSSGEQRRDFLHAADVAGALVSLLDGDVEGAVNIGSGSAVRVRDVVELLGELAGRPDLLRIGARSTAPGDPPSLVPDVTRLNDEVGWRPAIELRDGLRETLDWWRSELERERG